MLERMCCIFSAVDMPLHGRRASEDPKTVLLTHADMMYCTSACISSPSG